MDTLAEVRAAVTRTAEVVFRLDTEPEARLLRDPDNLDGVSASLASGIADPLARLWGHYPVLHEWVASGGPTVGAGALSPADAAARARRLVSDADVVAAAVDRFVTAWAEAMPTVERLRARLGRITADAARVGVEAEVARTGASALVEHLARQSSRDPLSVDARPAERAVDLAETTVSDLAGRHDRLPSELAAARAAFDRLRDTIRQGREALARTRSRIAATDAAGLLEPLDPSVLDGDERALGPWLTRLEREARDGRWVVASRGMEAWSASAAQWQANADHVLEANRGPLRRRDDLRGLLDALQAKSGARGAIEDPTLTEAYAAAHDLLHRAPCPLDEAEALVRRFAELVEASDERSRP